MKDLNKILTPLAIVIAGLIIGGMIWYANQEKLQREAEISVPAAISQPEGKIQEISDLSAFAKCLDEKGGKFYGAYWCGWCNRQKALFGQAAQFLPYIECVDPKTKQLTPECQAAGITGFPTWEFKGQKTTGFKTLEELAKLSGCSL
jgi:hypothetical protein